MTLVSHVPGGPSTTGNGAASAPVISGDGAYVAFQANASNLTGDADLNGVTDVFLFERPLAANVTVSRRAGVASASAAGQSLPGRSVSADGRFVVFTSVAPNLVPGQADTNNLSDVFLFDRVTSTTALVSHVPGLAGTTGNNAADSPVISGDGAYVAFRSLATNLVAGSDANGALDVFLYERSTGTVTLVSHVPGAPGTTGNNRSLSPVISGDGAYVAFVSLATNLVTGFTDANFSGSDIFLYERATGTVTLVSHVPGAPGTTGNSGSSFPVISGDGAFVAFGSNATDLVAGAVGANVFLYARATGTVTLVSHVPGLPGTAGNSGSFSPVISTDGAFVVFQSGATNLVTGTDANFRDDIFLYARATGTVTLVSHVPGLPGTTGNERSEFPVISGDGAYVAFRSLATNLVTGFTDASFVLFDVFLYERATGTVTLLSHIPGVPTPTGNDNSDSPVIGDAGTVNLTTDVFAVSVTGDAPADTTPPDTTITGSPANPTSATNPTFTFTGSDDVTPPASLTFECRLDGGGFAACTSPASYAGPLADGSHTFEVRARDAAGIVDPTPASFTWTVDAVSPETTITASPANPTNSATASFSFTSTEAGTFQCRLDGGALTACASPQPYSGLAAGAHTFEVSARDTAGNVEPTPATFTWTVDTTPPDTTITGGPSGLTNSGSASFTLTSTEPGGSFECQLDGGAWTACVSPKSYAGLADGPHTFAGRARDAAGNVDPTPAPRAWTVDATLPTITITYAGRTRLALARLAGARGEAGDASVHLAKAHRLFTTLRILIYVERTRGLAVELGVELNPG